MRSLTQEALSTGLNCWSSLFEFCEYHGRTVQRKVVVYHASSDFQGGLTDQLTETHTTRNCGYGFVFDRFALRQGDSNESFWEIVEDYLGQEKVILEIRSWDDFLGTEIDGILSAAIAKVKAERRARIDALLASLPEPKPEPKKPKVDFINDEVVDWDDFDEDDDYWG